MMLSEIRIVPCGTVDAAMRPPGSKSITNRALVCASLASGTSTLTGVLDSEDTGVMISGLRDLGMKIAGEARHQQLTVVGCQGAIPANKADLFVENSGTTIRFLTSLVSLGHGVYRLDGVPRMRERPIADLMSALNTLGSMARSELDNGCPPVSIRADGLRGGAVRIRGDISSQFLSGLLMVAPYAESDVVVDVEGPLVSRPYVQMTQDVMRSFGVDVQASQNDSFNVPRGRYEARQYQIEPDASAASYFWAAAAITGGRVRVDGLSEKSIQGDVKFCECLSQMGCHVDYQTDSITVTGAELHGTDVNMNAISDTVQTLAAVALFARGPTTITGVGHIRHKETDRIADLATELRKLGASVVELGDGLRIDPATVRGATIDTYNDHRMAMSLALVGLRIPGVVIRNPECTAKTYPHFFDELRYVCQSDASS